MTQQLDAPSKALRAPQYDRKDAPIILPKQRSGSPTPSVDSFRIRRPNPSLHNLYASTSAGLSSAPHSGQDSGTSTPGRPARIGSLFAQVQGDSTAPQDGDALQQLSEPRSIITRAFAPHVAILPSADTEEVLALKGFSGGFLEMVRPYGEIVFGKVTTRDSVGASKTFEDFGIFFTGIRDGLGVQDLTSRRLKRDIASPRGSQDERSPRDPDADIPSSRLGGVIQHIEDLVERHLSYAEAYGSASSNPFAGTTADQNSTQNIDPTSPFYALYIRRLLSGMPLTPHETFSHPVACIVVISSRNAAPIEELRRLYTSTNTGEDRLPQWVNNEFLRYYVLVHDEDNDDVAKSTQLYEQMKRHFGLHCHLLRLRSAQCVPSDDDSVKVPRPEWLSASEELSDIRRQETSDDMETSGQYLFDSDVTAIKNFIRELVTQSIIPSMERSIATWNEQVMTRRKGISGRLMSLSKRWTPFGSSSRNSSSPIGLATSSNTNYDSLQGFYRPDAPEAIMRKLADYAFMLRDYKLASSTYDLLRGDFDSDKAWKYYAGANEMAAVSSLLNATNTTSNKLRLESIDKMIESATHSYVHRCISPYYALRAIALGVETLKLRGSSAADEASKWAAKAADDGLVGVNGQALFTQRVCDCYSIREGLGTMRLGSRRRKAAFWAMLASVAFLRINKSTQSEVCLAQASRLYALNAEDPSMVVQFEEMLAYFNDLQAAALETRLANKGYDDNDELVEDGEQDSAPIEEVSEQLDTRIHRHSLLGAPNSFAESTPLSSVRTEDEPLRHPNGDGSFS